MHFVYILFSKSYSKFYIGYTEDIERRLKEHHQGAGHTTSRLGVIELVFYEAFKNKKDAQRRERYFKTSQGKKTLKLMLQESICPVV